MTFGWKRLGNMLDIDSAEAQDLWQSGHRFTSRAKEALAVEVFRQGRLVPEDVVTVFISAELFHDPGADRSITFHTGHHGEIIRRLVADQRFPRWLHDAVEQVSWGAWQAARTNAALVIGVYCKSGKHRSVAATAVLQHCLEVMEPWASVTVDIHHTSTPYWASSGCGNCLRTCQAPSATRTDALREARQALRLVLPELTWC